MISDLTLLTQALRTDNVSTLQEQNPEPISWDQSLDDDGNTCLTLAITHGAEKCVAFLITQGVNLWPHANSKLTFGMYSRSRYDEDNVAMPSLLHFTVQRSANPAILRHLIDAGLDVNGRDWGGATPLMLAAARGHVASMKLLLDRGADLDVVTRDRYTPLSFCYNTECIKLLAERGFRIREADTDISVLSRHIGGKASENIDLLLAMGANPNARGGAYSLLSTAAYSGDKEAAVRLLAAGAIVDEGTSEVYLPLGIAARKGNAELVKLFVQAGSLRLGEALCQACVAPHLDVMLYLINAGADVNTRTQRGTPLVHAAAANHLEAVRTLLDRGADVNLTALGGGQTPFQIAREPVVLQLLKAFGAEYSRKPSANIAVKKESVFQVGRVVQHPKLGTGHIEAVDQSGEEVKLTVKFAQGGTKKLLATFVSVEKPIEPVNERQPLDALLEDVLRHPHDPNTILVYADALAEREPIRAEGIATHIALTQDPTNHAARSRWDQLLVEQEKQWLAQACPNALQCDWTLGLISAVTLTAQTFVDHFDALLGREPVSQVNLRFASNVLVPKVANMRSLSRVRRLCIERSFLSEESLSSLLRSPHLADLESLELKQLTDHILDITTAMTLSHMAPGALRTLIVTDTAYTDSFYQQLNLYFSRSMTGNSHRFDRLQPQKQQTA